MDLVPPADFSGNTPPDNVTLEVSSGVVQIKALGVQNGNIAVGAIDNGKLADQSVTYSKLALNLLDVGKNAIINGNAWVAQRPTYSATVSGTYGYGKVDRWEGAITGTTVAGTLTQSTAVTFTGNYGETSVHFSAITTTGSGVVTFRQKIEAKNTYKFLGKALRFRCYVYHDVGSTLTGTVTIKSANALDNFAAVTLVEASGSISLPNTTSSTISFQFAAISTALVNGLQVEIAVNTGVVTNKNVYMGMAQLEAADISGPTAFEFLPWQRQYEMCQRYYWKTFPYATAPAQNVGSSVGALYHRVEGATNTATRSVMVYFPVQMRTLPTVTFYSTDQSSDNWYSLTDSNTSGASSAAGNLSTNGFAANNGGDAGDDEGDAVVIHATAEAEL